MDSVAIDDETQTMYDLDVETVDTFAVGDGAWVVHNTDFCDVFAAGGTRSSYTNNDPAFVAPVSQLAATMRVFPDRRILSVDMGAGGVREYLTHPSTRPVVKLLVGLSLENLRTVQKSSNF